MLEKELAAAGRLIEETMRKKADSPCVLAALDGPCASGKTTLAMKLEERLGCTVFHMDDFFLRPEQRTQERLNEPGGNVDYERFRQQVLDPLTGWRKGGQKPDFLTFSRYNCGLGRLETAEKLPVSRLCLIEGAYSQHPFFGDCYDLRLYLETDEQTQRERILARNGSEQLRRFETMWIPMEKRYFETFQIREKSRVISCG